MSDTRSQQAAAGKGPATRLANDLKPKLHPSGMRWYDGYEVLQKLM